MSSYRVVFIICVYYFTLYIALYTMMTFIESICPNHFEQNVIRVPLHYIHCIQCTSQGIITYSLNTVIT